MNSPVPSTDRPVHRSHLPFLVFICVASALGGLLWGFDAIVISGTINPVKAQFVLSPTLEGFFVSSGLLGAVIGSGLAGWLSNRFGRRRNLVLAAILLWLSAWGSAFAHNIELLIFARWLGGLGVGISAMVCPLYISEISPTHLRGRLVTVFQFAITIGIMVALFNNFGLHQWAESISGTVTEGSFRKWFVVDETWRVMFASELIPGLVFLVLAFMLPESPRWLIKAGRHEKARQVLQRIFRNGADEEFETIRETVAQESACQSRFVDVLHPRYRKALIIAMLLAAFAQFSGINVVFYYGTSLLETAGLKSDGALSGMAAIGFFNMIFTVIAMGFVDKIGRRLLLQIGTIGAIACLIGIGVTFHGMEKTMNYDLTLIETVDASALEEAGESEVIIALAGDDLHVRIFDDSGSRVIDKSEDMLSGESTIGGLKMLLQGDLAPDASKWKKEEVQKVILQAAVVSGRRHIALITLMCAFVAFFAFSLGPIKFIFASEIFPTNIRSHAMSVAILTMWAADTMVGQFTPALRDGIGASFTFFLFACFLVPQIIMVWKWMPETAGRSLEEIEKTYR